MCSTLIEWLYFIFSLLRFLWFSVWRHRFDADVSTVDIDDARHIFFDALQSHFYVILVHHEAHHSAIEQNWPKQKENNKEKQKKKKRNENWTTKLGHGDPPIYEWVIHKKNKQHHQRTEAAIRLHCIDWNCLLVFSLCADAVASAQFYISGWRNGTRIDLKFVYLACAKLLLNHPHHGFDWDEMNLSTQQTKQENKFIQDSKELCDEWKTTN